MDMGMIHLEGRETPEDLLLLAYGMEMGLRDFYEDLSERFGDGERLKALHDLSRIEETHMQRLYDLYVTLTKGPDDRMEFEKKTLSGVMEGGYTAEQFFEHYRESMTTVPEILSIAMMLETQALDLYLRYAQKIRVETGKDLFYGIAQEEKAHMERLGRLMDQAI